MTIEDILDETGGFGRFQLLIIVCICLNRFTIGWSMLQMSYDGLVPQWFCVSSNTSGAEEQLASSCYINDSSTSPSSDVQPCSSFQFDESPLTIINQWNLVCGLSWVKPTVASIQMIGVLAGVIVSGFLSDCIGRKKTMYLFVLEHAALNLITAFSVNWEMFIVCRFFIGLGIGVILVSSFPYPMEFLPIKWRPIVSSLPIWPLGIMVFALAGWLLENWSHLHIACGILSIPGLIGYFYVPESLRWLAVHDNMKEAQNVVAKIAVANRKFQFRKASIMLQTMAWEEQKAQENRKKSKQVNVFKDWQTVEVTLMVSYHWFSLSIVYFGLFFSAPSLAGNINLNIFLLAVMELPSILVTFFSNNRAGRKWPSVVAFSVACLAAVGCVLTEYLDHDYSKAAIVTGLCLTTKLCIGAAWAIGEAWANELYQPQARVYGLGAANIAARVGAVIAPFVIDLENRARASFVVMSCLLAVDIVLCVLTRETKQVNTAASSVSIVVARKQQDQQTHSVDMNNEHGLGNESSTDDPNASKKHSALEARDSVLDTIDEETTSNESDQTAAETSSHDNAVVETGDVALTIEMTDDSVATTALEKTKTDVSKDKFPKKDKKRDAKNKKAAKKAATETDSPVPKPRKNKLEKVKNAEFLTAKSKSKVKDDSPPYIESKYHKNIRYSIY
ncbi:unnamed protein product [Candidula unifasciata]|uniref:Major facilitator superfamily (MFS) profile domain-containing protein n=1 Tax=Candidula unifasciata TaxID=100452 RepID=A0A8S3YSH3_9EUPU|nr:unnamed protein product [Candidula unifasciata]